VTTQFRELPAGPRVDAVAIVTAVNTHDQVALAPLKESKHALFDKPLIRISVQSRHLIE
jgi:predicted dehydrogenase